MFNFKDRLFRKRFIMMFFGIIIMGLGVSLFKISIMGNDPYSTFAMSIVNRVGLSFSIVLIITNSICFLIELKFGKKYIGWGTFVNWFGVGIFTDIWSSIILRFINVPDSIIPRIILMIIGVLIFSFSCSLYQTADMGIAPYDAISLAMNDYLPMPYFWCRVIIDVSCSLTAYLLGGIVGLGTVFCALGMGPFVNFFNKSVSEKLLNYNLSGELS